MVEIRCCSVLSGVELQMVKPLNAGSPTLPVSGRQISGHPPASGSIENQTDSDTYLVASSLVASLDALRSAPFCWSSSLSFGRLSGLDCWSSHRRSRPSGVKLLRFKPSLVEPSERRLQ